MKNADVRKDILKILIVYLLSQGFLLILTGTFWDDWAYVTHNFSVLKQQYIESGVPSRILFIWLMWFLPEYAYRWVTFILFAVINVLYYSILRNIKLFTEKDALYITLICMAIPVNAARLIISNLTYTVGLTFFMIAFLFLIYYLRGNDDKRKQIACRTGSLVLFACSFILNANLVFYAVPLLYIGIFRGMNADCEGVFGRLRAALISYLKHIDFILAPIVFFLVKNICFPVYGNYADYNEVSVVLALKAVPKTLISIAVELYMLLKQFFTYEEHYILMFVVIVFIAGLVVKCLFIDKGRVENWRRYCIQAAVGVVLYWIGAFPYLEVRQAIWVMYRGVEGRDAILIPFGLAIFIYAVFRLLLPKDAYLKVATAVIVACGIISFNYSYLTFQKVSYWQNSLAERVKETDEIRENDTFMFVNETKFDPHNTDYGLRFYGLNGLLSNYVFDGEQTRLFVTSTSTISYLTERDHSLNYGGSMADYDYSDSQIDGVIVYDCDYSVIDTIRIKFYEMFDKSKYNEEISSHGSLRYYTADSAQGKALIK